MKFKDEVCTKFGTRMHKKQKQAFRDFVVSNSKEMKYESFIESGIFAKNIVVGNPDKAEIIFTAHYDTPPRLPKFFVKHMLFYSVVALPILSVGLIHFSNIFLFLKQFNLAITYLNIIDVTLPLFCVGFFGYSLGLLGGANKSNFNDNSSGCLMLLNLMDRYKDLPQELKNKIAFVFTDNEEKFLLGSIMFKNRHKNYKDKTIINYDCVGMGQNINLYHFGPATQISKELENIVQENNSDYTANAKRSTVMSMSDHFPVRKANHVCLLNTEKNNSKSLYSQIHSSNDTKIQEENIDNLIYFTSKIQQLAPLENELEMSRLLKKTKELKNELNNNLLQSYTNTKTNINTTQILENEINSNYENSK